MKKARLTTCFFPTLENTTQRNYIVKGHTGRIFGEYPGGFHRRGMSYEKLY